MEKNLIKRRILYLIPFILLFLFILSKNAAIGYSHDDLTFRGFLKLYPSLIEFSKFRYIHWTSRNIIECLILIFLKQNMWVWKITDSLIYPLIAFFTIKIIDKKNSFKNSVIACILVAIFYRSIRIALESTGILTTSINYIWPLLSLIIHVYLLKEYLFGKEINNIYKKILVYSLILITLLFAANNEQLAIVALGVYVFGFIYLIYKKIKIPNFTYLCLAILLIIIINSLICPGNQNRVNVALRFYPWYVYLNPLNKLNIGFSNILTEWITKWNWISAILFGLLGIYGYLSNKTNLRKVICFIPLIIVILFWIATSLVPGLNILMSENITRIGYAPTGLKNMIISSIIYIIFIMGLIYAYLSLFKSDKKLGYIAITLSLIALGSAVMYGFTPTILSRERMYIFSSACFLIIDYILISDLIKKILRDGFYKFTGNKIFLQKYSKKR